jgi:hypothetical protein
MTSGVLSPTLIPGWPMPLGGVRETLDTALSNAGFHASAMRPDGLAVADVTLTQNHFNTYAGSSTELEWNRSSLQSQLDADFDINFNLPAFIRAGTVTPVTGTQVANFLATITSNYRSKRSDISTATTLAQLNAININAGWPANP